jgi:hypothetical protein
MANNPPILLAMKDRQSGQPLGKEIQELFRGLHDQEARHLNTTIASWPIWPTDLTSTTAKITSDTTRRRDGRLSVNEAIASAIKSIWASRMRSFLTMLGIIIGIFAVTALISVGQSSNAAVTEQIESMGSNLITVTLSDRRISLSVDDIEALTELNGVKYASPYVSSSYTIKNANNPRTRNGRPVTSDLRTSRIHSAKGRFINDNDNDNGSGGRDGRGHRQDCWHAERDRRNHQRQRHQLHHRGRAGIDGHLRGGVKG